MKKKSLLFLIFALFASRAAFGQVGIEKKIQVIDSNWTYTHADSSFNEIGTLFVRFNDSTQNENKMYFGYVGQDVYVKDILFERHRVFKDGFRYRAMFNEANGKMSFINYGNSNDKTSCVMDFYESGQVALIEHYRNHDDPMNDTLDGICLEFDEEGTITSLRIYNDGVLLTK